MKKFFLNHRDNPFFDKIEHFKEKKWGMRNFFKVTEQEFTQFKEEVNELYQLCKAGSFHDSELRLQELNQTVMDLKQALESIHKNQVTDCTRFKFNLHSFEEQLARLMKLNKHKKNF